MRSAGGGAPEGVDAVGGREGRDVPDGGPLVGAWVIWVRCAQPATSSRAAASSRERYAWEPDRCGEG